MSVVSELPYLVQEQPARHYLQETLTTATGEFVLTDTSEKERKATVLGVKSKIDDFRS